MEIKVKKCTYRNNRGEPCSETEFKKEYRSFEAALELAYELGVKKIIDSIPKNISNQEKLKHLYLYMIEHFSYDNDTYENSDLTVNRNSPFRFREWTYSIPEGSKYIPILFKKGICSEFSKIFTDIAKRMGIPCANISGMTRLQHTWNAVLIDNTIKFIDVLFGILYKNSNPLQYFLITEDELLSRCTHHSFKENIPAVKSELENLKPKITIQQKPKITIVGNPNNGSGKTR